jgi:thioredoxin-like negative regulator of GroEL
MNNMTQQDFLNKVFNYRVKRKWDYQGDLPCVIDFYDDTCPPCRFIEPMLKDLSNEYKGKIEFYKVDIQKEDILSQELGIRNLPTLVLCPIGKDPVILMGAVEKEKLVVAIKKELLDNTE